MPSIMQRPVGASLRLVVAIVVAVIVSVLSTASAGSAAVPKIKLLHTTGLEQGQEVINLLAVDAVKLRPLLPAGYDAVPAAALGVGASTQGIVVIANFRGFGFTIDGSPTGKSSTVAVDVAILVGQPARAQAAGVAIAGAFHLYTLAIFTDDPQYAAALQSAAIPVRFVPDITYQRDMDDATGIGNVLVSVPSNDPLFETVTAGQGYTAVPGALDAVFWHDAAGRTAALAFHDEPLVQGQAFGQVYTPPVGSLTAILQGAGLGACPPDPVTGFSCVIAPSLNNRYPQGGRGKLVVITP